MFVLRIGAGLGLGLIVSFSALAEKHPQQTISYFRHSPQERLLSSTRPGFKPRISSPRNGLSLLRSSKQLFSPGYAGSVSPIPDIRHLTLVLAGDTGFAPSRANPHTTGVSKHGSWQKFEQTTQNIRHLIKGDINFSNMESIISGDGSLDARPKAFNFMTHPNGVRHLVETGFDLFSMANNHAFDYGSQGIRQSLYHLDQLQKKHRLVYAGIGLDRNQAARVPVFQRKETRFAFGSIGIGASGGGRARATKSRPGQLNIYNKFDYALLMGNLAAADADYRIISVHRGIERKIRTDRDEISVIRKRALKQGNADLVIGHHAHVARGG